mmetsp:Transcript_92701/g.261778  ORF Transcript_92701/g.261778 Transcript_92701/m.261778 type:complete len:233 (-) Transcript_92701:936-1634(-)
MRGAGRRCRRCRRSRRVLGPRSGTRTQIKRHAASRTIYWQRSVIVDPPCRCIHGLPHNGDPILGVGHPGSKDVLVILPLIVRETPPRPPLECLQALDGADRPDAIATSLAGDAFAHLLRCREGTLVVVAVRLGEPEAALVDEFIPILFAAPELALAGVPLQCCFHGLFHILAIVNLVRAVIIFPPRLLAVVIVGRKRFNQVRPARRVVVLVVPACLDELDHPSEGFFGVLDA